MGECDPDHTDGFRQEGAWKGGALTGAASAAGEGASEPSDARRIPGRTHERIEILEGWVFRWWGR